MKIFFLAIAAGLLAIVDGCDVHFYHGWSDADLTAAAEHVQTVEIPAGLKNLDVDNRYGDVRIIGTNCGPFHWTGNLRVWATNDLSAQRLLGDTRCEAKLDGDRLTLAVTLPDVKEPHKYQSDFEITVPQSAVIHTRNRFGATEIAGVTASVDATGENGPMKISHISGGVRAQTSFATLSVNHKGAAVLRGQNGAITAVSIQGALDAATSFAALTAKDIGGAATLHDQNGTIEVNDVRGALEAQTSFAPITARTIGGPVHLLDQNGRIEAAQIKGNAEIETSFSPLDVTGVKGDAILMNQNGSITANDITGSVKASTSFAAMEITGAGSNFICHDQNGSIQLRATSLSLTNIEAKTSFSALNVRLPAGLKPAIKARTSFADVESDFPVLMKPSGEDPFADITPDTPRIKLLNQNGKIRVTHD